MKLSIHKVNMPESIECRATASFNFAFAVQFNSVSPQDKLTVGNCKKVKMSFVLGNAEMSDPRKNIVREVGRKCCRCRRMPKKEANLMANQSRDEQALMDLCPTSPGHLKPL